jgi:adenylylsulfate reductase subunit B
MPLGSSTYPMRGTDSIMWTIKFRDQKTVKRFKFPIRTTAEGSIDCFKGKTLPSDLAALKQPGLYTGPARKE